MKLIELFILAITLLFTSSVFAASPKTEPFTSMSRAKRAGIICLSNADCNFRGLCTFEQKCVCDEGYAGFRCVVKQKDQSTAFFLHVLFGWSLGAGDIYLGKIQEAKAHLAFFSVGTGMLGIAKYCGFQTPGGVLFLVGGGFAYTINFLWWLAQTADLARNQRVDSERYKLNPW